MKLNQVKVKVITATDGGSLESSINTFLQSGGERTFIGMQLSVGSTLAALITYME